MTETKIFHTLRDKLITFPIKILRIETGQSLPDLFYYSEIGKFHGWIEMKHVPSFTATIAKPKWQPGQLKRMQEMYNSGIWVWLLLVSDDKKEFCFIHGGCLQKEYPMYTHYYEEIKRTKELDIYNLLRKY